MKKFGIIFLLFLFQTGFSQSSFELELLLEKQIHAIVKAESQLDSLEQSLDYLGDQLETEKRDTENAQKNSAEWYQNFKQLSETIKEQKHLIDQLYVELNIIKNKLDKTYQVSIDSLNKILIETSDKKLREEIQRQIYTLSEKRLLLLPAFKSFSFDPRMVAEIDLKTSNDSLEEAIYRDYLNNARTEISQILQNVKNIRQELEEIIYLRERSNRFLEDMNENRPLIIASQPISERSGVFSAINQGDALVNLPPAESLINMLEQFKPEYYPEQNFSWTSPVDSGKVIMTLDEYKDILESAEDILQSYLQLLDKKVQ